MLICISQRIRICISILPVSRVCSFVSCDYQGTWDIKVKVAEKSMKVVCQDEKKKKTLKTNKYSVSFIMKQVAPDCWRLFGACHHHFSFKAWTAFSIGLFAFWNIHIVE